MPRPFRFALQAKAAEHAGAWRDMARKLEDLGFSTLYVPDHFREQWGPLVALTVAAEATETLNVGTLLFDNDYRHPMVLAKEMATLDLVSTGRVEFGLGAGWMRAEYEEVGIPYDEPGVRVDRLEESLTIIKGVWSSAAVSFEGSHYQLKDAVAFPRPHSPAGPRIVVGGGGKRVLSLAAREADIVGFNVSLRAGIAGEIARDTTAAHFMRRVDWVKEAAGHRFGDLDLQILTFMVRVVSNRDQALANMARLLRLTPEEASHVPMALVGTAGEICETLQERRETFGFNYIVIHQSELDAFAPVVASLAGT